MNITLEQERRSNAGGSTTHHSQLGYLSGDEGRYLQNIIFANELDGFEENGLKDLMPLIENSCRGMPNKIKFKNPIPEEFLDKLVPGRVKGVAMGGAWHRKRCWYTLAYPMIGYFDMSKKEFLTLFNELKGNLMVSIEKEADKKLPRIHNNKERKNKRRSLLHKLFAEALRERAKRH